jgi:hypothetical protein
MPLFIAKSGWIDRSFWLFERRFHRELGRITKLCLEACAKRASVSSLLNKFVVTAFMRLFPEVPDESGYYIQFFNGPSGASIKSFNAISPEASACGSYAGVLSLSQTAQAKTVRILESRGCCPTIFASTLGD